jgi:hypothetical protein
MKNCKICNNTKPLTEFGIHKYQPDGYNIYCKECLRAKHTTPTARLEARRRSLKATYGITLDHYDSLLKEQDGKCAICGEQNKNGKPLSVDHCHSTSAVRGLLCEHCNHGLGKFFDNINLLQNATNYLQKYKS